ncbi:MAG TPA: AAA family ATPase [Candidatus Saccharimonadales bacterium]|nr:AAA family ATPase [Candidatus Saccharimonadales bacterium]
MILQGLRLYDPIPADTWPFYVPAVRHIVQHGLTFKKPITFIVGENGSGKSTVVEAIAETYGLDVRGGHGGRKYGASNFQKGPLSERLRLDLTASGYRTKYKGAQGFFLRSETAMGVFEYMSSMEVPGYGPRHLGRVSHGEGYIQVLLGRFKDKGLYLLDEPEAALSFTSCLALMKQLHTVVQSGAQVICATHSPIITALPGADILEFNQQGVELKRWAELDLVQHWQRYMAHPDTYLKDLNL